jgi:hypothetical protein
MLGSDPEVSVGPQGDRSHPADWGWPEWWGSNGHGDSYIPPLTLPPFSFVDHF